MAEARRVDERAGCAGWEHLVTATRAKVPIPVGEYRRQFYDSGALPRYVARRRADATARYIPDADGSLAACWREAWAELDAIDFANGLTPPPDSA